MGVDVKGSGLIWSFQHIFRDSEGKIASYSVYDEFQAEISTRDIQGQQQFWVFCHTKFYQRLFSY
jgi:hypothetical protein